MINPLKIINIAILAIFLLFVKNTIYSNYAFSGKVSYSDNGSPVNNDKIYILYYNSDLGIPIILDSTNLNIDGSYSITTSYPDSMLCCIGWVPYAEDDHVQTYYPSTINWQQAQKIYPPDNPININIIVTRIIPMSGNLFISSTITTLDSNNNIIPLSGAIVIAKQDTTYRNAAITDSNGYYKLDSLTNGTFTVLATKIGYSMDSTIVNTNGNNINSNHPVLKLNRVQRIKKSLTNRVSNQFILYQNYPNPFNPSTKIKFSIPLLRGVPEGRGMLVTLKIYDILGREVATLVNESLLPGTYEIEWNSSKFSSGIYFYELISGNQRRVNKMLFVK